MGSLSRNSKGFTLLEILIVLVILAVVAGLATPAYISAVEKARKQEALMNLGAVRSSQQRYYAINAAYGSTYTQLDFNPTVVTPGNTPHFTYAAPSAVTPTTYNVVATRNATDFSTSSGCPAGYTVSITQNGDITSTC